MYSNGDRIITADEFVNPSTSNIIPSKPKFIKKEEDKMAKVKISEIPEIKGFSFVFCKFLLKYLKELEEKDAVFEDGILSAARIEKEQGPNSSLTPVAIVVINHLEKQLMININTGANSKPSKISKLIAVAGKFILEIEKEDRKV